MNDRLTDWTSTPQVSTDTAPFDAAMTDGVRWRYPVIPDPARWPLVRSQETSRPCVPDHGCRAMTPVHRSKISSLPRGRSPRWLGRACAPRPRLDSLRFSWPVTPADPSLIDQAGIEADAIGPRRRHPRSSALRGHLRDSPTTTSRIPDRRRQKKWRTPIRAVSGPQELVRCLGVPRADPLREYAGMNHRPQHGERGTGRLKAALDD